MGSTAVAPGYREVHRNGLIGINLIGRGVLDGDIRIAVGLTGVIAYGKRTVTARHLRGGLGKVEKADPIGRALGTVIAGKKTRRVHDQWVHPYFQFKGGRTVTARGYIFKAYPDRQRALPLVRVGRRRTDKVKATPCLGSFQTLVIAKLVIIGGLRPIDRSGVLGQVEKCIAVTVAVTDEKVQITAGHIDLGKGYHFKGKAYVTVATGDGIGRTRIDHLLPRVGVPIVRYIGYRINPQIRARSRRVVGDLHIVLSIGDKRFKALQVEL
ncbi:hypothetical protein FVB9532_03881 [Mesonia oceanica]|uniref:Uncharacterized protein n=1 Tax=Mesonia oceanica TaxID=2687242 RepID=A0AC61YDS0_9FLAO|nr:hypothetical protein FVB9532_03881 [Mesonia oceanica]